MTQRHRHLCVGEDHPKARLTNPEIERMRQLRDAGWSYGQLQKAYGVSKGCVVKICLYQRRAVVPI